MLLDLFDSYKWSNTYWCYFGGFTDTEVYKKVLTRPHPVAVTGEIESYGYDRENKEFHLSFVQLEETKAKTEIFVPSVPKYAELDGEEIAIKEKRKHISCYIKNMKNATEIREKINKIEKHNELEKCLIEYFKNN